MGRDSTGSKVTKLTRRLHVSTSRAANYAGILSGKDERVLIQRENLLRQPRVASWAQGALTIHTCKRYRTFGAYRS